MSKADRNDTTTAAKKSSSGRKPSDYQDPRGAVDLDFIDEMGPRLRNASAIVHCVARVNTGDVDTDHDMQPALVAAYDLMQEAMEILDRWQDERFKEPRPGAQVAS